MPPNQIVAAPCFPCTRRKLTTQGASRTFGGGKTLDTTTLFAANTAILWVMALAFGVAGYARHDEPWWESWILANLVLGVALAAFTFERHLSPLLTATLPNGLLVLGFGLRWRAAREFSRRDAPGIFVWGPLLLLLAIATPFAATSYATVFTATNIVLTILSVAVAWEFWRDRNDGLPSRYWLVAAYGIMGLSFAYRIALGLLDMGTMPAHLPRDLALVVHLCVALFHTVASGAFALSLAYERNHVALTHAATHDALTGLVNRGAFEKRLRAMLAETPRKPFALALLDIDHFKRINDRYGHAAGDAAIRQCGDICRTVVGKNGWVARIGGEEFAIVLNEADQSSATAITERIRHAIGTSDLSYGLDHFRMTVSGGVCHSDNAPASFDELMRIVDCGLYEAKHKGRNRVQKTAA